MKTETHSELDPSGNPIDFGKWTRLTMREAIINSGRTNLENLQFRTIFETEKTFIPS